ncbi:MAG: diguanylate cyclase [Xanthobacteraceae bacterium]|nr:diguanylate cyclase [Xanthobacteraceae bacterium]
MRKFGMRTLVGWLWAIEDRMTLRMQIGAGAALLSILMVGALTAGAAYISSHQVSGLLDARLAEVARGTSERLDRYMFTRQRELRLFAGLDQNGEMWTSDPSRIRKELENLKYGFEDFAWIGLADTDGKVVAATGRQLEGVSVATQPWFKNGLKGIAVEDMHEAALLAPLLDRRHDDDLYRFVDIAMPIKLFGQTIGVLGAYLNWDWPKEMSQSVSGVRDDEVGETDIWILGKDGIILLGPSIGRTYYSDEKLAAMRAAKSGTFVDRQTTVPVLTAFSTTIGHRDFGGLGWIVVARRPADVALAAAAQTAWWIAEIGLAIGLFGIAGALMLASRIARPIQSMTSEADLIGRDPKTTMLPRQRGSVEATQMTRSLRSLLRRVGFAEERTREAELRASDTARQFNDDIEELRKLAATDPLTNLMNRRAFLDAANDAMDYYKRYRRGLSALMIDIDHFKKINDTHGHAAGDEVIKRVAQLIGECIRSTDKVARLGGEEFIVLLREADLDSSNFLAERIRRAVADGTATYRDAAIVATVSVGVTIVAENDRDVQDLIERADQALYLAKNNGRNCVRQMLVHKEAAANVA